MKDFNARDEAKLFVDAVNSLKRNKKIPIRHNIQLGDVVFGDSRAERDCSCLHSEPEDISDYLRD